MADEKKTTKRKDRTNYKQKFDVAKAYVKTMADVKASVLAEIAKENPELDLRGLQGECRAYADLAKYLEGVK